MAILANEIVFVLSGGSSNTDPNASLGGNPSIQQIPSGLINNLFNDVGEEDSLNGITDHRCIYIFNDSVDEDTLFNARVWIETEVSGGSNIQLGSIFQDELQRITIIGTVTGGTITISIESYTTTPIPFNSNVNTWALNIQNALNALPILSDVIVTGVSSPGARVFDVLFTGDDGNKSQELMSVTDSLTPTTPDRIIVAKVITGSPINAITASIDAPTTTPTNVVFSYPLKDAPLFVGNVRATEGFFLWIKRDTPPNTAGVENDGVFINVRGNALNL